MCNIIRFLCTCFFFFVDCIPFCRGQFATTRPNPLILHHQANPFADDYHFTTYLNRCNSSVRLAVWGGLGREIEIGGLELGGGVRGVGVGGLEFGGWGRGVGIKGVGVGGWSRGDWGWAGWDQGRWS